MNYSSGEPNPSIDQKSSQRNPDVERILDNLLQVLPVFHKKLLRMDLGGVTGDLTRLHLSIMWMLSHDGRTVSELARHSAATKSHMTHLIDQLVEQQIVERRPDATDRRVTNLALTNHGKELLAQVKRKVQDGIRTRLAVLTAEELTAMAGALETLRDIGGRLQAHEHEGKTGDLL